MRLTGRFPRSRIRSGTVWASSISSPWAFRLAKVRQGLLSLSSSFRANLRRLTRSPTDLDTLCQQLSCHARKETSSSVNLCSHINSKLKLNDVKAVIRVVASDDANLKVTPEVLQTFRLRHSPIGIGMHHSGRQHRCVSRSE